MKPLKRHRVFEKHFKKRVLPQPKLLSAFEQRLELFVSGGNDAQLNDHALSGALKGKRAFSITRDVRVIYIELDEEIVLLDIGTHNQVY